MSWSANGIAAAAPASVEFTDKSQLGQYLQGAVDGGEPDTGVVLVHPLIYGRWGEVVGAGGNVPYHRSSLGCELVAVTSQSGGYSSLGKPHFKL